MSLVNGWLRLVLWICVLVCAVAGVGCDDLINPQRQKEIGVHEAVVQRYDTATGFHSIISKPKFPGLRKSGSLSVEVLDDSDPAKLEEAIMETMKWYAESNAKMNGLKKIYIYALKDGEPYKVAIFEAASLSGKDMRYEDPSPENLPGPGE